MLVKNNRFSFLYGIYNKCQWLFFNREKENLAIIRRSGEHLLNLTNDVLDMSKIEAGRMVLNEKVLDLYRLLDDMEDMFCLEAEEKGLQLAFECDAGVPQYIRTDEGKLRQVLMNLVGNAIKFTENGSVTRLAADYRYEEMLALIRQTEKETDNV